MVLVIVVNTNCQCYYIRTQAIYRVLQSVPITCTVTIVSDSQASIKAITSYYNAISNRKRLRMTGRPLLQLIYKLLVAHKLKGSEVRFKHVTSHTARRVRTQDQVGNSCADRVASHYRKHPSSLTSFKQLQLHLGEQWIYIMEGNNLITSDVRTALRRRLKISAATTWYSSSKHNLFACVEVKQLSLQVLQAGKRERTRCVLALLTDSFQYHSARADRNDMFGEYECNACNVGVVADVKHVLNCSARSASRASLCVTIRNELNLLPAVRVWIESNVKGVLSLFSLMCLIFDLMCDVNNSVCWRVMIGAFSDIEASEAMKRIGQKGKEKWNPVMENVRVLLFDYVYSIWRSLRS